MRVRKSHCLVNLDKYYIIVKSEKQDRKLYETLNMNPICPIRDLVIIIKQNENLKN